MNTNWFCGNLYLGRGYNNKFTYENKFMEEWSWSVKDNDTVWILGNVSNNKYTNHDIFWNEWLSLLPGKKKLLLGCNDAYPLEFYSEFYDSVCAMNRFVPLAYQTGKHGDPPRSVNKQVMVTYLPADGSLYRRDKKKYTPIHLKFKHIFKNKKLNFILNIHSHTQGNYNHQYTNKTYDIWDNKSNLVSLSQIFQQKFLEA